MKNSKDCFIKGKKIYIPRIYLQNIYIYIMGVLQREAYVPSLQDMK